MPGYGDLANWQRFFKTAFFGASTISAQSFIGSQDRCLALKNTLSVENTTILDVQHIVAGSKIPTPGSCQSAATVSADVCRIYAVTNTTSQSAVHFEMWLPDQWYGRFLAVGNGGLAGCIDYMNLDYGSLQHFATIGSDNGHDGSGGAPFLNQPEVINDFAFRAVHVEAVLGKQITQTYYDATAKKSYYLGCSTGGRQGIQSALLFPDDFDGIVAGAPAVDFNHLLGWSAILSRYIGAPDALDGPNFIPYNLWPVISAEILRQCDGLDGVEDGIITEPDQCDFRPESLLCSLKMGEVCLTATQVQNLKKIYRPLFGRAGDLIYPRFDPGAEGVAGFIGLMNDSLPSTPRDWFRFAIYNDSKYSFENFSLVDIEFADSINPGGVSTWNGDLSTFRDRGGKIISYHGRRDQLIPSGNSKRLYDLISTTLSMSNIDDFYRLFLIPGMNHCGRGPGAHAIGQGKPFSLATNDTSHNVLLAIVDWVERGNPPDTIIGTNPSSNTARTHCRYPQRSIWNGESFVCKL
ncbi:hypothetical protein M422DRAFT_28181 [Sphaerobolus stellatus SS14]|nr:hypothetical protein M422DRAFT_28181 [Sphaerobolus stellatus SS14]